MIDAPHNQHAPSLEPLFRPRSVAVIGASPGPGSIGGRVFEQLLEAHFNGPVYPVHPTAYAVSSVRAYATIGDVPDEVDLAVIAVPAPVVPSVVEQCAAKGVRAIVVLSAGFAEVGEKGRALQDQLLASVRGHGMRMVGPNCLGVVNTDPRVQLNAIFGRPLAPHGNVGMSSQSGAMGLAIIDYASELGLGISQFVSVGNKADVSGNDLLEYWEHDPDTDLIALYLESFGNPRRFGRIARRVARQKPILAVKSGRGRAGSRAARSHTAALASNDTAVDALFHQAGIIRLDTLEELFDVAALLANQPLPAGDRVAIVSNAGGPGILCADACEANQLQLPALSAQTLDVLRAVLPSTAGFANPVDMVAAASPDQYQMVTQQVLLDPAIDSLIVINISIGGARAEQFAAAVRAGAEASFGASGVAKPVLACFMANSPAPLALRAPVSNDNAQSLGTIPAYRFPESPARALARAVRYRAWRDRPAGHVPVLQGVDQAEARAVFEQARARDAEWLSPDEAQRLMKAAGIPIARQQVVPDAVSAASAAEVIGFPVVVKVIAPSIVHKSDVGGVALDLASRDAVLSACEDMRNRIEVGGVQIEGFLVQEQAQAGHEVLVGVTADPMFGPLVAFGLGGVTAEALHDTTFRITPLDDHDAEEMVRAIRGHVLLEGFRGHTPADIEAIKDLLLRVSWLADIVHIEEMDLNPVVVNGHGQGLLVLDVRVAIRPSL